MILKVLVFAVIMVHGTDATCCCSGGASIFPRIELTPEQQQTLLNLADYLELLPCEERTEKIYNMTESPIELTDAQLIGIAQRYSGSFQDPSDPVDCEDERFFESSVPMLPQRKRRAVGTSVCPAVEEVNQKLFLAYSKSGGLVYVAQPSVNNGFQQSQYVYETICSTEVCDSPSCACSTVLIPSGKSVVNVIRGGVATFTEEIVMTRACRAFSP
ncbi:uncharacterized protein LOC117122854 [Anneissia japonica]|uniref:uncharacterized protein LOC117122854 n=1 Tax=Anneissia japonica TaxID=1529436 RepID=UPI001425764A|nr:uncharacterized protein LOC117122854 [Anneissia japonica]